MGFCILWNCGIICGIFITVIFLLFNYLWLLIFLRFVFFGKSLPSELECLAFWRTPLFYLWLFIGWGSFSFVAFQNLWLFIICDFLLFVTYFFSGLVFYLWLLVICDFFFKVGFFGRFRAIVTYMWLIQYHIHCDRAFQKWPQYSHKYLSV